MSKNGVLETSSGDSERKKASISTLCQGNTIRQGHRTTSERNNHGERKQASETEECERS